MPRAKYPDRPRVKVNRQFQRIARIKLPLDMVGTATRFNAPQMLQTSAMRFRNRKERDIDRTTTTLTQRWAKRKVPARRGRRPQREQFARNLNRSQFEMTTANRAERVRGGHDHCGACFARHRT